MLDLVHGNFSAMNKGLVFLAALFVIIGFSAFRFSGAGNNRQPPHDSLPLIGIKAKDFKGKNVISTNGSITLSTGTDNDYYQVDSSNKTGYFYIETKIARFLNDNASRVPLNISIVIDRSGSMEGVKMGHAKKAAKSIIDLLRPEDIVSVVIYDNIVDSVQVPVLVTDKESIKKKIDQIIPRSATNLWGGSAKGYEYVLKNYKQGYINRVLLISDGLANVGVVDPKVIHLKVQEFKDDNGVTLSTFGVGLDYNETLMTDMAETGAGNYYFIDNPAILTSIFTKELNGMMDVAAQNAELKIRLPQGIKILNGYPLKFTQAGNEISIKLRDLFSEEVKGTVFRFSIPDKTSVVLKFSTTLSYTEAANGKQMSVTNENTISPVKSTDAYLTHFNKPVIEQTILYTANENLEEAMALVDKGDYDGANDVLVRGNKYLARYSSLTKKSDELRRMDSVNKAYMLELADMKNKNTDSVKKIQKVNKNLNYNIRQKKQ